MQPVVLDTSACLLPFLDRTDVAAECERLVGQYQFIVPESVHAELNLLAIGQSKRAQGARMAMRLYRDARPEATDLAGDDGVLEVARRLQAIVVTNDRVMQSECKRDGLRCLQSRGPGLDWA